MFVSDVCIIHPLLSFHSLLVMMGFVAVLVTRYRITVFPAVAFLVYTSFRLKRMQGSSIFEASSPLVIAAGLLLMHYGRTLPEVTWTLMFWIGTNVVLWRLFTNVCIESLATTN